MIKSRGINLDKLSTNYFSLTVDDQVTIIIPCYKQSKFLLETVESVLAQTVLPKQIIVLLMDLDSWKLQPGLKARDPSIRAINSGHRLLPSARNFCIGVATTPYVIPLDSDDTLPTNFIEETRKIDADIVYVGAKLFDAATGNWPPDLSEEIDWDKQTTLRRNPIVCTALIKRKVWESIGGYSDTLTAFEDMEFWIRAHDAFVNTVGTGPHVITRILQEMTNFIPDGLPQTIISGPQKIRLEPACTFTLDDEPSGAYNYAIHLYSSSWTDRAGAWADVVRREYDKWKKANKITEWRG